MLFGQNAPGGLFNLISKRPTKSTLAELQVDLGSFAYHQVKGDVGGAFDDSQSLYGRLTVLARDAGTYLPGKPKDDRIYVASAITFEPSSSFKITAYAQYLKNEGVGWPFWYTDTALNFTRVRTYDPNFDRLDQHQILAGWFADWDIGSGFSFRQNARYGRVVEHTRITDANAADPGITCSTSGLSPAISAIATRSSDGTFWAASATATDVPATMFVQGRCGAMPASPGPRSRGALCLHGESRVEIYS